MISSRKSLVNRLLQPSVLDVIGGHHIYGRTRAPLISIDRLKQIHTTSNLKPPRTHRRFTLNISHINKMPLKTLSASKAADLDKELMSSNAFSLDQLMELAGLSVAQALYALHPLSSDNQSPKILVICGPGNNGGDGLVAARHLHHFGYKPIVHYPKQSKNELYQRLVTQLEKLNVPFTDDFRSALKESSYVIDAIFGFSFSGEVREPFGAVVSALEETSTAILSVDAPSSWDIEKGPPESGPGAKFMPGALISLTAPKPLVKKFKGRHFVGGRFLSADVAKRFEIDVPPYKGSDQILEIDVEEAKL